ncbi:MAG: hypothetical protein HKN92_09380 [Chitinophagales bacterium]|nr:hypothetical protein [Chitinophagales bacterium]
MKYLLSVILLFSSLLLFSQEDTTTQSIAVTPISEKVDTTIKIDFVRHSPKKAALLSAALPGLGQAYNKKYWKIPIIYAGFGGLAYAIQFNASKHRCNRNAYRLDVDGDSLTDGSCNGITDPSNLRVLRDFYRRNLDLAVLGTFVWYGLQIIDATVDAHLFEFRLDDEISLGVDPHIRITPDFNAYTGLKITLKL